MRWGPEGPPPEAYSRVTSPERFAVVVDAADALVDDLVGAYDVVRSPLDGTEPAEFWRGVRGVRLLPREEAAAPLSVAVTAFPGVHVRAGRWWGSAYPMCGCDACDEDPEELVEQMRADVADVVAGRLVEWLRLGRPAWARRLPAPLRLESAVGSRLGDRGTRESGLLDEEAIGRALARGAPGSYRWEAWPRR